MGAGEVSFEQIDGWLPEVLRWAGRPTGEVLDALPGSPAVLLLLDECERPIQALSTQALKRVARSRLLPADEPVRGRADLAAVARGVRWRVVHSPFEARWWYYRLVRQLYPDRYRKLISFGPAWFLTLDPSGPAAQLRVTERIWRVEGPCVGPFATSKSAQAALEGLWNLFDLCRYPEQLRKAPGGTRCAYYDMGRCDGPCDGTVGLDAYRSRTEEAWRFVCGAAGTWREAARERMMAAAGAQHFEQAGLLKEQIAFAERWQREWSGTVLHQDALDLLLLMPATRRKAWTSFLFRRGVLEEAPLIPDRKLATAAAAWTAERVAKPPPAADATVRMEQTWLVAHLLRHKEGRTARVVRLGGVVVEDVSRHVAEAVERIAAESAD